MLLVIGMTLYVAAFVGATLLVLKTLFKAYKFIEIQPQIKTEEKLSKPRFKIEVFASAILMPAILILFASSEVIVENKSQHTGALSVLIFLIAVAISYAYLAFDGGDK